MQHLAIRALLSSGGASGAGGGLDDVLSNVTKVVEFSGTMLSAMLANPIYAFLFAVSFIGIGISIVRLFRRGSKG